MLVRLRDKYWMVRARCICNRAKRQCVSCQRQDVGADVHSIAHLPDMWVLKSPFSVVGIDHGGPLYCCEFPGTKLVLPSAVVLAVYLELFTSLFSEATPLTVIRFIAHRVMLSVIMPGNAKGFTAASLQLVASVWTKWSRMEAHCSMCPMVGRVVGEFDGGDYTGVDEISG